MATDPVRRSTRPDDQVLARLGRLLLVLDELRERPIRYPVDAERIALLDFCADHPHVLYPGGSRPARELAAAGFAPRTLSYASLAQRFANRRATVDADLAHLIARRLVDVNPGPTVTFALGERGQELAERFESAYADAYRLAARYTSSFFRATGKTKIAETARRLVADATLTLNVMPLEES